MSTFNTHTEIETIPLDESTSGDLTIIQGQSDRWIYIHQISLFVDAATDVTIKKGTDTFTGPVSLSTGQGFILEASYATESGDVLYKCPPGVDFIINSSNAVGLTGSVNYSFRY